MISLHLFGEVNNKIISKILGISEVQVGALIHQSRDKLRKHLEVPL
jgi:DNA-directed RNA polymerase specialized sigma subunit